MMTEIDILKSFGSKVAEYCIDIGKEKIIEANRNRKANGQSMETRIYQVIVDALNECPYNKYKKKEQVYNAAESILKQFRSGRDDYKENVKAGLQIIAAQVTSETCEEFLKTLCHVICMDENDILYKEIILIQGGQTFETVREGFDVSNRNDEKTHEKLDYVIEGIDKINEKINRTENGEAKRYEIPIKNRAGEYADKWEKNVFLNDFNKRDKNAGVNIKLQEIYPEKNLPHYKWKSNDEESADLKGLLREYIVDNDEKKMLLILGQAGIGKSTLITWIMANLVEKKESILVYQFASDLENIDWQGNDILNDIFKRLGLRYDELESKVLILDGFDEIHASSGKEKILNQIYYSLKEMSYLKQISLIITCRENYIDGLKKVQCEHITLQTWNDEQIISFCKIYVSKSKRSILQNNLDMMLENKKVFGIPLILYMVLALDVSIERNTSLVDIYDKIFAVDGGGIYDRCINDLSYGKEHRISEVKQQIHQVSQRIAFWIFESNSGKAVIPRIEFRKICDIVMKETEEKIEDIQSDVLIGSYFEPIKCYEGMGTDELQFVHRSIYEYFVSIYFFESMRNLTSKEELARKLGLLLKYGYLSEQMLVFLKYKFDDIRKYNLASVILETFQMMLRDGMTYHTGMSYKNAIECELNIFDNMLKAVHLWNYKLGEVDKKIVSYIKCENPYFLNLSGIILNGVDLSNADLCGADLCDADLNESDLSRANLSEADLSGASLKGVDLSKACLFRANLSGADLSEADLNNAELIMTQLNGANLDNVDLRTVVLIRTIFDEEQVKNLQRKYDLSGVLVYLAEIDEVISYKEYCIRKQKNGV